jgi:nitroreductase
MIVFPLSRPVGLRAATASSREETVPMFGFDAEAVAEEFGLAEDEVPVMLLSVGRERPGNWPQKPRLPVAEVLDLV